MSTSIITVRELIELAFGNKDKSTVNFKHVETILYLMARQLSVLQRQVEVSVDPQLISELTRKPSNLSVTEVKIHATVPEALERELFEQIAPLHPMVLEEPVDESLSSPDSLVVSESNSPQMGKLRSSVLPETSAKAPRVSYGGVHSKNISPHDSDSDDGKKPFSFEFTKPKRKIQQEKYLAVKRRDSEDTVDAEPKLGTGSPEDKYKTVSVVTKEQYMKLLEEIAELNEARKRESKQLPESKALIEELHRTASITHPISALILSDRLEQSEKKLQQMVAALETYMKQVTAPKLGNVPSNQIKTTQGTASFKNSSDKSIMTVSHAIQMRRIPRKCSSSKQAISTWKWEQRSSTDFWSDTFKADETSVQIALTQLCRAYDHNKGQESMSQLKQLQQISDEDHGSMRDLIQEEQETSDDQKAKTRFLSEDISTGQSTETEAAMHGRESCVKMSDGTISCDPEKCTLHCQQQKLNRLDKRRQDSNISLCCSAGINNISKIDGSKAILLEKEAENKQNQAQIFEPIKPNPEESKSLTILGHLGKQEKDTVNFMPHILNNHGELIPSVNDEDGKSISPSDIEAIYDIHGQLIPRVYSKDSTAIPWSRIGDHSNAFDKDGNLIQQKYHTASPKSDSEMSFYDENGKKVQYANADEYDILYDKIGKTVPRIFDNDGNPVPWSRVNDFARTRNKYGNMMSHLYDQNGVLIPWWDLWKYDKVYDKSGEVIPRFSNLEKLTNQCSNTSNTEFDISEYDINKSQYIQSNKQEKKRISKNLSGRNVITSNDKNEEPIEKSNIVHTNGHENEQNDLEKVGGNITHKYKLGPQVQNAKSFFVADRGTNSPESNSSSKYGQLSLRSTEKENGILDYENSKQRKQIEKSDEIFYDENDKKLRCSKERDTNEDSTVDGVSFGKESNQFALGTFSEVNGAYHEEGIKFAELSETTHCDEKPEKELLQEMSTSSKIPLIITKNNHGSKSAPNVRKIHHNETSNLLQHDTEHDKQKTIAIVEDIKKDKRDNTPHNYDQNSKQISVAQHGAVNVDDNLNQTVDAHDIERKIDGKYTENIIHNSESKICLYDRDDKPIHEYQIDDGNIVCEKQDSSASKNVYYYPNVNAIPWIQTDGDKLEKVNNENNQQIKFTTQKNVNDEQVSRTSEMDNESNIYDRNGKRLSKSKIDLNVNVFDKYGHLIPRVYDGDGKPILWSLIDKTNEIYDQNGLKISRVYTKDGELIPLSLEAEYVKVYNKNGDIIHRVYDKDGKLIPFSRIENSRSKEIETNSNLPTEDQKKENFYDNVGNPIPWPEVNSYNQVYNKDGKLIARAYDSDAKPISWSQMDDILLVYDKRGKLIPRVYDENGKQIPWSLVNIQIQEETNITDKHYRKDTKNKDQVFAMTEHKERSSAVQPIAQVDHAMNENKVATHESDENNENISSIPHGFEHVISENPLRVKGPINISEQTTTLTASSDPKRDLKKQTRYDRYVVSGMPDIQTMHSQAPKMHPRIKALKNVPKGSNKKVSTKQDKNRKEEVAEKYDPEIDYIDTAIPDFADFGLERICDLVPYIGENGEPLIYESKADCKINDDDELHGEESLIKHEMQRTCDKSGMSKADDRDHDVHSMHPHAFVYDIDGNPIYRSQMDIHKKIYDKYGNLIPRVYDENNQPISWSKMDRTDNLYDDKGKLIPTAYNKHGKKIPFSQVGNHPVVFDESGRGFVYDENIKPIPWSELNKHKNIYDKYGHQIPRVYTKHGQPIAWSDIDDIDKAYDENGTLIPRAYDQDGKPIPMSQVGNYPIVFDKSGKKYEQMFFDQNGKAISISDYNDISEVYNKDGKHIPWSEVGDISELYDKYGKPVVRLFDKLQNPIPMSCIPSIIRKLRYYDKYGVLRSSEINEEANFTPGPERDYYYTDSYDDNGNPISRVHDRDENPIPWSKIHETETEDGKKGNLFPRTYDNDGSTISVPDKIYDKYGNLIPYVYDKNGNPVPWTTIGDTDKAYDRNGKLISEVYDKDGNQIPSLRMNEGDTNGYPASRVYDIYGNPIPRSKLDDISDVYDQNGMPLIRFYDKNGNTIPWSKLDDALEVYDKSGHPFSRMYSQDGNHLPWSQTNKSPPVYDKDEKRMSQTSSSFVSSNIRDKDAELLRHSFINLSDSKSEPIRQSQIDDFFDSYDKLGKNRIPGIYDKDTTLSIIDEIHELDHENLKNTMSQKNFFDKNGNPLRLSELENNTKVYDKHGNVIPVRYDSTGIMIPWLKLEGHDRVYDKNGKFIPRSKIFQGVGKDLLEIKRRSLVDSLSSRRSLLFSSSTFGDLTSRSYSGQRQSLSEGPDLKILDWALQKELNEGMEILKDEFGINMDVSFERPTKEAQQTTQRLTKMRDQLQMVLTIEKSMPDLDSKIAQFSQRITAIELHLVQKMTRYQEEITQQQMALELALEAMVEAIANVTGDPQGIEEVNGKLLEAKNDIDAFSLAQRDLQDSLNNLKLDLRELRSQVHMLSSTKADRKQVSNALKDKATIADLNQLVSREEFGGVMAEMIKLIEIAYDKFNNQEHSWQEAIDDFVKCLNKKAGIKSMKGLSDDIMRNIKKLRERKDNLLHLVGEPDMTYNRRQIHRDDTCFCCDTAVAVPDAPKQNPEEFETDKANTSPESSKRKPKGKSSRDRIVCYPGLPPNHDLDARSIFCNRYCGPAQNTALFPGKTTEVLIPKELVVKPVMKRDQKNERKPAAYRKPCLPCNRISSSKQGTSNTKSEGSPSSTQSVTVIRLDPNNETD